MHRNLVVITFDSEDRAEVVLETMKSSQKHGFINLEDTVVVKKDEDGKIHSKNAMDKTTKEGIVGGGLVGMFLSLMFLGPIGLVGAAVIGGVVGGGFGALLKKGVDKDFIKDVEKSLQPGTSAIFLVVRKADVEVAMAALRQFDGKVLQSTLPEDAEEELERALNKKKTLPATGENAPRPLEDGE